jgi:PilZ domain-containing protein
LLEVSRIQPRNERRSKPRVTLTRGLIAHFGGPGAVLIDASEGGARIEHFTRHKVGKKASIRFQWNKQPIETEAVVVWSRVHRLADSEQGAVFQSGLSFIEQHGEVRNMVTTLIARSAAEQMANARGIEAASQRRIPASVERGYVRCVLIGDSRWDRKWTQSAEQPTAGFTVPASETDEDIAQLCDTYIKADQESRKLIQLMARLSVEKLREPPGESESTTPI